MNKLLRTCARIGSAAALLVSALSANAQTYPAKPIKLIVPYAPGGSVDAFARVVAPALEARLGQTVVIDNIPGAGGTLGVGRAVKAAPDGYTIVMGIVSDVVLAPLTERVTPYAYSDLQAIAPLGTSGLGVIAKPALGIRSLSQLVAYAKANPGKLSYGSTGAGSLPAIAMEAMKKRANIDLTFIPYASASKIALDVMGGHLDIGVSGLPALLEHIKSGKVTAVGVMSKERDAGAPEIVSANDTPELKGMDFYFWTGIFAPKGTPAPIVERLNKAFQEALRDEQVQQRFKEFGVKISDPMTPAQFATFVAKSNADWQLVLKQIGHTPN